MSTCPRCSLPMPERPALSRTDNDTPVCSECGVLEALEQFQGGLMPQSAWDTPPAR